MLLHHNATHTRRTLEEAKAQIATILGTDYEVEVPEQNPLIVGAQSFYRVRVRSLESGASGTYHVALTDGETPDRQAHDQLKNIKFSLNPFRPSISIDDLANGVERDVAKQEAGNARSQGEVA